VVDQTASNAKINANLTLSNEGMVRGTISTRPMSTGTGGTTSPQANANTAPVTITLPTGIPQNNVLYGVRYSGSSLTASYGYAAHARGSSSFARVAIADDDGGIVVGGSLSRSPSAVTRVSDLGGTSTPFTANNNDNAVYARWLSSGTLGWIQRVDENSASFSEVRAIGDDPNSGLMFLVGYTRGSSVTFGPGEAGQVIHAYPVAQLNPFVLAVNRVTGLLQWVQPIRDVSLSSPANLCVSPPRVINGNLHIFGISGGTCEVDRLTSPQTVNLGTANFRPAQLIFNATTGDFVEVQTWSYSSADSGSASLDICDNRGRVY
jgi:hypothetical protein